MPSGGESAASVFVRHSTAAFAAEYGRADQEAAGLRGLGGEVRRCRERMRDESPRWGSAARQTRDRAEQVHVERLEPHLVGRLEEWRRPSAPGGVYDRVQRAGLSTQRRTAWLDALGRGDVAVLDAVTGGEVDADDSPAVVGQSGGGRLADAGGGAGD